MFCNLVKSIWRMKNFNTTTISFLIIGVLIWSISGELAIPPGEYDCSTLKCDISLCQECNAMTGCRNRTCDPCESCNSERGICQMRSCKPGQTCKDGRCQKSLCPYINACGICKHCDSLTGKCVKTESKMCVEGSFED